MRIESIGWIIGTGLLIAGSAAWGLDVEARLDREVIRSGESVQLTLRMRGGDGSESPDLRPLERDFRVLDIARSLRTQVHGGHYESSVDWMVSLLPLRAGSIEVPSIEAAGARSHPQVLEVIAVGDLPAAAAGSGANAAAPPPPVFLESEVDASSPYVQAEVSLRVRLFADARVRGGSLSDPLAEGALVERVGEDREYRERRDGRDYTVVERRYAIFPQRSGALEVTPAVFEGRIREERPNRRGRRNAFGAFHGASLFDDAFPGGSLFDDFFGGGLFDEMMGGGGRMVRVEGQRLSLDVRPRPEAAEAAWWIPARDVQLVERWADELPTFRVGEPVERLVAIRARGISVSQLPELELPGVDGFKQYSEPVADETVQVEDEVVAIRARNSTLIPTRAGTLSLPALELEWWDTQSESPRTARLPARSVEVLPARGASAASAAPPPTQGDPGSTDSGMASVQEATGSLSAEPGPAAHGWALPPAARMAGWFVLALGTGALAWGMARRIASPRTSPPPAEGAAAFSAPSLAQAERRLRRACAANDPLAASRALAAVGVARWPVNPPLDAGDWAKRLGGRELAASVETLQRVRYSPEAENWKGSTLWQAYRASRRRTASTSGQQSALPGLYPARGALGETR